MMHANFVCPFSTQPEIADLDGASFIWCLTTVLVEILKNACVKPNQKTFAQFNFINVQWINNKGIGNLKHCISHSTFSRLPLLICGNELNRVENIELSAQISK